MRDRLVEPNVKAEPLGRSYQAAVIGLPVLDEERLNLSTSSSQTIAKAWFSFPSLRDRQFAGLETRDKD
jgi:hypothetical protein